MTVTVVFVYKWTIFSVLSLASLLCYNNGMGKFRLAFNVVVGVLTIVALVKQTVKCPILRLLGIRL